MVFGAGLFFGCFYELALAFLTALIHECAHLLCALFLKEKCVSVALMPYGAKLVGKIELNDQRSTPFVNGNNVQLYVANGTDVTCYFVDVNGAPIEKNTTRDGVVMSLASTAHRPICFYPGQVLTIRVGGHTYGTFSILDIQTN